MAVNTEASPVTWQDKDIIRFVIDTWATQTTNTEEYTCTNLRKCSWDIW
jgi:hypothetical protein